MMNNNKFDIYASLDNATLCLKAQSADETLIQFDIRNMSGAKIVSAKGGSSVNIRNDSLSIIAFKHDDSLVVQFINKSPSPEGYHLRFENDVVAAGNNSFSIIGAINIYVLAERCTCVAEENALRLYPTGTHTILTFYVPSDANNAAFSAQSAGVAAMADNAFSVPAGQRLPEFSIAVFDDSGRTTPRPMRLGVPVISMIPVFRQSLSESELQVLEIGKGTSKRTMYFKIISDTIIPDNVEPVLHIYLPEGLDTVGAPVSTEMVRQVSSDASRSVFYASYVFHEEDTVDYVDGFAYLSVYMPMELEVDLSLAMAVTVTGDAIVDPYVDNPELG